MPQDQVHFGGGWFGPSYGRCGLGRVGQGGGGGAPGADDRDQCGGADQGDDHRHGCLERPGHHAGQHIGAGQDGGAEQACEQGESADPGAGRGPGEEAREQAEEGDRPGECDRGGGEQGDGEGDRRPGGAGSMAEAAGEVVAEGECGEWPGGEQGEQEAGAEGGGELAQRRPALHPGERSEHPDPVAVVRLGGVDDQDAGEPAEGRADRGAAEDQPHR